jgi:hypothetical protein
LPLDIIPNITNLNLEIMPRELAEGTKRLDSLSTKVLLGLIQKNKMTDIAEMFDISQSSVSKVINRRLFTKKVHLSEEVLTDDDKRNYEYLYGIEEWRDVVGFEGYYKVSSKGNIARVKAEGNLRPLKPGGSKAGLSIVMHLEGKPYTRSLPNLIAIAFLGEQEGCKNVRFIDGDCYNCNAGNLEWMRTAPKETDGRSVFRTTKHDGAWMMSSNRAYFQNNKQAILQQLVNEKL